MSANNAFPTALRNLRKARGLAQEAFSEVSSRTYLSSLERGIKNPTLTKIEALCGVMGIHPLTLLALTYAQDSKGVEKLLARVQRELADLRTSKGSDAS